MVHIKFTLLKGLTILTLLETLPPSVSIQNSSAFACVCVADSDHECYVTVTLRMQSITNPIYLYLNCVVTGSQSDHVFSWLYIDQRMYRHDRKCCY